MKNNNKKILEVFFKYQFLCNQELDSLNNCFKKSQELTCTGISWTVHKARDYEMHHRALLKVLELIKMLIIFKHSCTLKFKSLKKEF